MRALPFVIASLITMFGCDRGIDPAAIDPHREATQKNLAALDDIGRQLATIELGAATPPLALRATRFATDAQLAGRVSLSSTVDGPMPDGIVLDASMVGPEHHAYFDVPIGDRATFLTGARRVTSTREALPGVTASAVQDCRRTLALKSVVIVRVVQVTPPRVTSSSAFETGSFVGEALGFELENGRARFVGGFRFEATNSADVRVRWESDREYQRQQWLASDLTYNAYVALFEGLRTRVPAARLPPTEGYRSTL